MGLYYHLTLYISTVWTMANKSKIILVTGGARSGKSSFALELAESISPNKLFIATCPAIDPEMGNRIVRHKEERKNRGWDDLECELDLQIALQEYGKKYDVILLDCITLWVNNILFQNEPEKIDDSTIKQLCLSWLQVAGKNSSTLIVVTNEVGLGIVPDNPLARRYRDLVGTVNQTIGKLASDVVLVSCGVPLYLKKS